MSNHTMRNADVLHLGCGDDYHDDAWNVDVVPSVNPDQVVNIDEYPWPWPDASFREIRASHVFEHLSDMEAALRESARVLEFGGRLTLRLPMGNDALADPDHTWGGVHPWTWRTPLFYTGARHWDVDVGLRVETRAVDVWPLYGSRWRRLLTNALWHYRLTTTGPGEWCFELTPMSGEFTVVFRK